MSQYIETSLIAYDGPSLIDGLPIIVILTSNSKNPKTGDMVQSIIIRKDIAPHIAIKTGDDYSICGNCIHRRTINNSCYVQVHNAPLSVYRAYHRDRYAVGTDESLSKLLGGKKLRIGTYGDPAAVPTEVWSKLASMAAGHTGYTHQWRKCDAELMSLCMASCDTPQDRIDASDLGYRTFRIRLVTESIAAGEFVCPASSEGGHRIDCNKCNACSGTSRSTKQASPVIIVHGAKANAYKRYRKSIEVSTDSLIRNYML